MHEHGNEKPVTYLNKGQPYSLTVADSMEYFPQSLN
jgi:hypothetical protein